MGKWPEGFQPVAFLVGLGDEIPGGELPLNIGFMEDVDLPTQGKTMYVWCRDYQTGRGIAVPYEGDIWDVGEVPVITVSTQRAIFQQLVESYDPFAEPRSPRIASTRKLPADDIIRDYFDENFVSKMESKIDRLGLSGADKGAVIEVVMEIAKQLEDEHRWLPPGPHMWEKPEEADDGVEF